MVDEKDKHYLKRCVELAEEALNKGDRPFGSVLVSAEGNILYEDHNHIGSGDLTQHPEFNIARWAGQHMTPEERAKATVYTSGEHCPMCSAAHGLAGLGRIVYASSSRQLGQWLKEMNVSKQSPIRSLSIQEVIKDPIVDGPDPELAEEVRELHRKYYSK